MNHKQLHTEMGAAMNRRKELERQLGSAPHEFTDDDLAQGVRVLAAVRTYNKSIENILDGSHDDPQPVRKGD